MVLKIHGVNVIGHPDEPEGPCAFCGDEDELRPFGPNDELICFDCAMKPENKATTERKFREALDGKPN